MTAPAIVVRVRSAAVVRIEWSDQGRAIPPAAWSITGAVIDVFEAAEVARLRALEAAGVSVPVIWFYAGRHYIGAALIEAAGVYAIEVARGVSPIEAAGWSFVGCGPVAVVP